jgi:hypothetical protein
MDTTHFFFCALTLAQRALAAARIRAMPAGEMRLFTRSVPDALPAFFLTHRAFCASDMRRRAAADMVPGCDPFGLLPSREIRILIASSMRSLSCSSSLTTASRFAMRRSLTLAKLRCFSAKTTFLDQIQVHVDDDHRFVPD